MATVTVIMRGDQYALGMVITHNDVKITPDDVTDMVVRIGIGDNVINKSYSLGELSYDDDNDRWLFPLTSEQTRKLSASVGVVCQAQAHYPNTDIRSTSVTPIEVRVGLF